MLDERFWSHVQKTDSCWNWTAYKDADGYGHFPLNGKFSRTHRLSYENVNGVIPKGLVIDHLCRNRKCLNPEHLEVVTIQENVMRGIGFPAKNARKTHCPQGHEYNEENTYLAPRIGRKSDRQCFKCRKLLWKKYNSERRYRK